MGQAVLTSMQPYMFVGCTDFCGCIAVTVPKSEEMNRPMHWHAQRTYRLAESELLRGF